MTDHPIMFSGSTVRALLGGHKTQTRRLARRKNGRPSPWQRAKPGDRLWVRESVIQRPLPNLLTGESTNAIVAAYAADDADVVESAGFNVAPWWKGGRGLPGIHMPRWASRLTLVLTGVKTERLRGISEEDALAEGIQHRETQPHFFIPADDGTEYAAGTAAAAFACLWEALHGAGSWYADPEVVALTFTVYRANFQTMTAG